VPKGWNFSVLGVFATKGVAEDKGNRRSGAPATIGRVQGKTELATNYIFQIKKYDFLGSTIFK
jgi:hypothetical protein